jgi:hypothetical protein
MTATGLSGWVVPVPPDPLPLMVVVGLDGGVSVIPVLVPATIRLYAVL